MTYLIQRLPIRRAGSMTFNLSLNLGTHQQLSAPLQSEPTNNRCKLPKQTKLSICIGTGGREEFGLRPRAWLVKHMKIGLELRIKYNQSVIQVVRNWDFSFDTKPISKIKIELWPAYEQQHIINTDVPSVRGQRSH